MDSTIPGSDTQQIWTEFGHRLRAFIARRVDSEADADDILQDVFLRIHRHAATVERSERLVSWLFQVTRNAIADYYRAPGRRRELPADATHDRERGGEHVWGRVDDLDGESLAARRELATCLGLMVEQLPPLYRDAVRLVDLEGLPQQEAAARSGITVSGMKSRAAGTTGTQIPGARLLPDRPRCRRSRHRLPAAGDGCGPCAQGCERDDSRSSELAGSLGPERR